jgi:hypothetical protein
MFKGTLKGLRVKPLVLIKAFCDEWNISNLRAAQRNLAPPSAIRQAFMIPLYIDFTHVRVWIFNLNIIQAQIILEANVLNPSSRTMDLGLTHPINEYQESSWVVKDIWHIRQTTLPPSVSQLSRENMGVLTSHNPMILHGLLQG